MSEIFNKEEVLLLCRMVCGIPYWMGFYDCEIFLNNITKNEDDIIIDTYFIDDRRKNTVKIIVDKNNDISVRPHIEINGVSLKTQISIFLNKYNERKGK